MGQNPQNQVIRPMAFHANISPNAFYRWSKHFYACRTSFRCPDRGFSPVPYFLLGRSIELAIKARHLTRVRQPMVKASFGHDLKAAYDSLEDSERVLSDEQYSLLTQFSAVYKSKAAEYFVPMDALTAFKRFPHLESLDGIARTFIEAWADLK
jgi:hypothetical protein